MVERHARAEAPVALDGRMFIEGEERVLAVDVFNGTLLWKRDLPGAVRVKTKRDGGNMVVATNGLYVAAQDKCYRLDPVTGRTLRVYQIPTVGLDGPRRWGYISVVDHVLYGSAATAMSQPYAALLNICVNRGAWKDPQDIPATFLADYQPFKKSYPDPTDFKMAAERSGLLYRNMTRFAWGGEFTQKGAVTGGLMVSDRLFAIDTESGNLLSKYDGKRIANVAIVNGEGRVFFADADVTNAQTTEALARRRQLIDTGVYTPRTDVSNELTLNKQQLANAVKQRETRIAEGKDHRHLDRVVSQPGGALVLEFQAVPVQETLVIELAVKSSSKQGSAPAVCFIEVLREKAE